MRDLFNLRRPQPATLHEPEPERPERAGSEWDPINPRDGKPRLVLTWVTTEAGSGFAVDTFNIATEQIAGFYMDGGAAVASLTRQSEGEINGTATAQPAAEIPQSGAARSESLLAHDIARARALIATGAAPAEE